LNFEGLGLFSGDTSNWMIDESFVLLLLVSFSVGSGFLSIVKALFLW